MVTAKNAMVRACVIMWRTSVLRTGPAMDIKHYARCDDVRPNFDGGDFNSTVGLFDGDAIPNGLKACRARIEGPGFMGLGCQWRSIRVRFSVSHTDLYDLWLYVYPFCRCCTVRGGALRFSQVYVFRRVLSQILGYWSLLISRLRFGGSVNSISIRRQRFV